MSAVCLIQARMESTRLPGKVLKTIGHWPAVYHVYQRARLGCRNTVVCLPATPANDPLAAYLATQDIPTFRWDGPVDDVLGRFAAALQRHPADIVVRVTADCPFLDPVLVAEAIRRVRLANSDSVYVSNTRHRTYPRGLDVEACSRRLLEAADALAVLRHDREHVTPMVQSLAQTTVGLLGRHDYSHYRWTLDTADDLAWFRRIADRVDVTPPDPIPAALLALLHRYPALRHYEAPLYR